MGAWLFMYAKDMPEKTRAGGRLMLKTVLFDIIVSLSNTKTVNCDTVSGDSCGYRSRNVHEVLLEHLA